MSSRPRIRYQVRVRRAVAGSFLAAASAVSITGMSAVPAVASSSSSQVSYPAPASAVRLAGVRSELDYAVTLGSVTADQADAFYAQIERRVAAGL